MHIPERLRTLERDAASGNWLGHLPELVSDLARAWDLELGPPYEGSNVSYVAEVVRGTERLVLKVQWPHDECAHEADALRAWDGDGAIRLVAHDGVRHALLLERCVPGTCLAASSNVDPMAVLIEVLPRLWKPAGVPFKSLHKEAGEWAARCRHAR